MYAELLLMVACLSQMPPAPAASGDAGENVEVRYARAQLQLAEANLSRVEQSNKRVPGSIPSSVVAEYQSDVAVAKTRLEQAAAGQSAGSFQAWLRRGEAEQKATEMASKKAAAANIRLPGTFGPLELERFRLRAEVARLQLERGQALVGAGREAQAEWKIDLLDNQVQRLKEEARRPSSTVSFYPSWPW